MTLEQDEEKIPETKKGLKSILKWTILLVILTKEESRVLENRIASCLESDKNKRKLKETYRTHTA